MESVKKYSIQTIAIIVLSVLLAISVAVGGTMAWFADRDTISGEMTMGQAVLINIADHESKDAADMTFDFPNDHGFVLPSMSVGVDSTVLVRQSNTPVYLRALITLKINGQGYDELAGDANLQAVYTQFWEEVGRLANGAGWFQSKDATDKNAFDEESTTVNDNIGDYFYLTGNVNDQYEAHASSDQYPTGVPANTSRGTYFFDRENGKQSHTLPSASNHAMYDYKAASSSTVDATTSLYRVYVTETALGDTGTAVDGTNALEIALLYGYMTVPEAWNNTVAEAVITFDIKVEAIQGLVYDTTVGDENKVVTSIADVSHAFAAAATQDDSVNDHDTPVVEP